MLYIQDRFDIDQDGHHFSDAIVLPVDEYNKLDPKEIEDIKQARFDNWVEVISTPPEPVELTKEDIEAQIVETERQINELTSQKAQMQVSLVTAKPKPVEEPIEKPIEELPVDEKP